MTLSCCRERRCLRGRGAKGFVLGQEQWTESAWKGGRQDKRESSSYCCCCSLHDNGGSQPVSGMPVGSRRNEEKDWVKLR